MLIAIEKNLIKNKMVEIRFQDEVVSSVSKMGVKVNWCNHNFSCHHLSKDEKRDIKEHVENDIQKTVICVVVENNNVFDAVRQAANSYSNVIELPIVEEIFYRSNYLSKAIGITKRNKIF